MGAGKAWLVALVALTTTACRGARPVRATLAAVPPSRPIQEEGRPARPEDPAPARILKAAMVVDHRIPPRVPVREAGGSRRGRDPGSASGRPTPGWAGLRLDLGAGQAPYDDAPPTYALLPTGSGGFSGSLVRVVYEGTPVGGVSFQGGVAASRFQDEPLMSGLRDAELAWLSFGLRFRF